MKESEIRALIRKERNSINDSLNDAFKLRDRLTQECQNELERKIQFSMTALTQHLEGEFLRRQHYLERHFEKEIKEAKSTERRERLTERVFERTKSFWKFWTWWK